jgi:hypothetical protein
LTIRNTRNFAVVIWLGGILLNDLYLHVQPTAFVTLCIL